MSGLWVRCPNCDLEVKVELLLQVEDGNVDIEPDLDLLGEHARNCAAR
jgi:hypothetical protein